MPESCRESERPPFPLATFLMLSASVKGRSARVSRAPRPPPVQRVVLESERCELELSSSCEGTHALEGTPSSWNRIDGSPLSITMRMGRDLKPIQPVANETLEPPPRRDRERLFRDLTIAYSPPPIRHLRKGCSCGSGFRLFWYSCQKTKHTKCRRLSAYPRNTARVKEELQLLQIRAFPAH